MRKLVNNCIRRLRIRFIYKIIGGTSHGGVKVVLLGDVLDYGGDDFIFGKKYKSITNPTKRNSPEDIILELWEEKRLPIEEQSNICVKYIFEVIKKKIK